MQTTSYRYNGNTYQVTRIDPAFRMWSFTAHGETILHDAILDLPNELGNWDAAWGQYIDAAMVEAGTIRYDDDIEAFVPTYADRMQVMGCNHPDYLTQN